MEGSQFVNTEITCTLRWPVMKYAMILTIEKTNPYKQVGTYNLTNSLRSVKFGKPRSLFFPN